MEPVCVTAEECGALTCYRSAGHRGLLPQPLARSTEVMTGMARRAAIMLDRCFTLVTSTSISISKKSIERLVIFRLLIFPWFLPMMVDRRSEEHTSELQSLMRISHAVLCLQTKL